MEPIGEQFSGKSVLVAGATGMLGMYTAAKLLRDVPNLAHLVLPIRGKDDNDVEARWRKLARESEDAVLFEGADLSKVILLPVSHLDEIPDAVTRAHQGGKLGPVHGVIYIAADTSWTLGDEGAFRANAEAPLKLYLAAKQAPEGHPLRSVEGWVGCTTFGVFEVDPPKEAEQFSFLNFVDGEDPMNSPSGSRLSPAPASGQRKVNYECASPAQFPVVPDAGVFPYPGKREISGPRGSRLPAPHVVNTQRLHPGPLEMKEAGEYERLLYGGPGGYGRSKRRCEVLFREASDPRVDGHAMGGGRFVPLAWVRPSAICGCSALPGAIAPPGWANQGNMNVPMAYYIHNGKHPDGPVNTAPKVPFHPPRAVLSGAAAHMVPVDCCANIHIAALACTMSHPKRAIFGGDTAAVFNAAHDQRVLPFSFWDHVRLIPGFDESSSEPLGLKGLHLAQRAAKDMPGEEGDRLRKQLRIFQVIYRPAYETMDWELQTSSTAWLGQQLAPEDKNLFPVDFTAQLDMARLVKDGHDYAWRHIVKEEKPKGRGRAVNAGVRNAAL